jgi:hypothetical protein
MKLKQIGYNATQFIDKNSPYISFGFGVLGLIGAVGTAINATMKLSYILDEFETEKQEILGTREAYEAEKDPDIDKATFDKGERKAIRRMYAKAIGKAGILYAPTAACTALSIVSFTVSVGVMRKRYLAASGALTGVTEAFERYRERVRKELGEDKDLEYYYGLKKEKIEVEEDDPETGKVHKKKKEMLTGTPKSMYSRRFKKFDPVTGEGSTEWESSGVYSYPYISGIIKQYQRRLDAGIDNVKYDKLLEELGFKADNYYEVIAGWKPGDKILCGLEDGAKNARSKDVYDYLVGNSPDVTLTFNPRPDLYGVIVLETELSGDNDTVDTETIPMTTDPSVDLIDISLKESEVV